MNRDLVKMLEYEAKRKPLVGELWDRLPDLSDEEIDAASLPLPWFRKAFREARERFAVRALVDVARDNPIDPSEVSEGANVTKGWTAEYLGDTAFFISSTGFSCEVMRTTWLFFPDDGGAWDGATFFADIPSAFKHRRDINHQTRHEYVLAWFEELNRRY